MILNFIFSNLDAIVMYIWIIFLAIVACRYFQPLWVNSTNKYLLKIINVVKNISFSKLVIIALGLNIFYGLFVTWGQYYTWSTISDMTRFFLTTPLSAQVPFPSYLEWIRPIFENNHGYFMFYVWGRVWMNIFILFSFSGVLYLIFRTWKSYRGGFLDYGPELMLILMLISGWMGVIVSLSVGFIFAVLMFVFYYLKDIYKNHYHKISSKLEKTFLKKFFPIKSLAEQKVQKIVAIEPAFIFATLFALVFTRIILSYF
jgi:hypothetical protein